MSAEAGASQALYSTSNEALRSWNSRSVAVRHTFDVLRRVTHLFVKIGTGTEFLAELTVYGEMLSSPTTVNMLGRVYHVYDGAGVATNNHFDFKGNLLSSSRVLALAYTSSPDWSSPGSQTTLSAIESAAASLLSTETPFTTTKTYDALNRVTSITTPDTTVYTPTYNEANQLKAVDVAIRGITPATNFVNHIEYNARGQRIEIDYVGTSAAFTTTYAYEAETFRLARQITRITSSNKKAQDGTLTYDPVGNIVEIDDNADEDLYFSGIPPLASAGGLYEYDAIYRLTSSTGREHPGQTQPEGDDSPWAALPHPNNTSALRSYTETFTYDEVGNITQMFHDAVSPYAWTRNYTYDSSSNKLATTDVPGPATFTYTHDARGNMTAMLNLSSIGWDWADRMQSANLGGGGNVYFTYDSGGNRVRKVCDKSASLRDERIYLGNYELWRESDPTGPTLKEERQTVHVMDDVRRIAMIETLTVTGGSPVTSPSPRQRFQISNQLESAVVELTETGALISYEEYFAFGMTSFHSMSGAFYPAYVSLRRYRYNGKERDEETGLYYYGARYYAAWLGRWTAVDPASPDGSSRYAYVHNRPVTLVDPNGREDRNPNLLQAAAQEAKTFEEFQGLAAKLGLYSPDNVLSTQFTTTDLRDVYDAVQSRHAAELERASSVVPPPQGEAIIGKVTVTPRDLKAEAQETAQKQKQRWDAIRQAGQFHTGTGYVEGSDVAAVGKGAGNTLVGMVVDPFLGPLAPFVHVEPFKVDSDPQHQLLAFVGGVWAGAAVTGLGEGIGVTPEPTPSEPVGGGSAGASKAVPPPTTAEPQRIFVGTSRGDVVVTAGGKVDAGLSRELRVAEIVGGRVARQPGSATKDLLVRGGGTGVRVDVVGPGGELIQVGGPSKAADIGGLGSNLDRLQRVAAAKGVSAQAYFEEGTPANVLDLARNKLGAANVHTFPR